MSKPKIYLFCNTKCNGRGDCHSGMAMAEDGHVLAGHLSSNHAFCKIDLGLTEESDWSAKRKNYAEHYPDGYECVWLDDPANSPELDAACALNKQLALTEKGPP